MTTFILAFAIGALLGAGITYAPGVTIVAVCALALAASVRDGSVHR